LNITQNFSDFADRLFVAVILTLDQGSFKFRETYNGWQRLEVMHELGEGSLLLQRKADENKEPKLQTKPTALVVDDSTDIAFMMTTILQQAGYEALMATSAIEALKLVKGERFDLVICDIAMPEMDGYALAKALRSLPEYQAVPIIAVTGFDQYDDRERAIEAGFDTHLKKPIDPGNFMKVIRSLTS